MVSKIWVLIQMFTNPVSLDSGWTEPPSSHLCGDGVGLSEMTRTRAGPRAPLSMSSEEVGATLQRIRGAEYVKKLSARPSSGSSVDILTIVEFQVILF